MLSPAETAAGTVPAVSREMVHSIRTVLLVMLYELMRGSFNAAAGANGTSDRPWSTFNGGLREI